MGKWNFDDLRDPVEPRPGDAAKRAVEQDLLPKELFQLCWNGCVLGLSQWQRTVSDSRISIQQ
jgi:hypothetical protein